MAQLQPGQEVGPYRVIEQVGRGGMATVFKAYQPAMDRHVAIKILPFQFAEDEEFLKRFRLEVRLIARLEHPRILPVYDSGEHEGAPYLVMRYLESGTLKERLQQGQQSLQMVDKIFMQLADALGYAHSEGIVHRDIKPSNVLANARGDIFLTDFGIAKLVGETTQFTASGAITGTPTYMSPEQANGEKLDQRSDIYSLGIVLYEMVTGRVPFEADTPLAIILKHLQSPLPPPRSINPSIDPEIEKVLLKALSKKRDDRFQTTAEFSEAWTKALAARESSGIIETHPSFVGVGSSSNPDIVPPPSTGPHATKAVDDDKPKKARIPSWAMWLVGGLLGLSLLIWGGSQLFNAGRASSTEETDPVQTEAIITEDGVDSIQNDPSSTPTDGLTINDTPIPQPESENLQSWVSTNHVYTVTYHDGHLYTGGIGGITVWDLADMSYEQITYKDGLPGTTVFNIFFDEAGVMWVGGNEGLSRYDGETWSRFDQNNGIDAEYVTAFAEFDGNMLVGTYFGGQPGGGLGVIEGSRWNRIPNFDSEDGNPEKLSPNINDIAFDGQGGRFIGTENGLGVFDGENWFRLSTEEGLPDNEVLALMFDRSGALYIGTAAGAIRRDGSSITPLSEIGEYAIREIRETSDGFVWFAGDHGAWRLDPTSEIWSFYGQENGVLPVYSLSSVAVDENGILYFGAYEGGIFAFGREAPDSFTQYLIPNMPIQAASAWIISSPDERILFVEESGANVDTYDPGSNTWSPFRLENCCPEPIAYDSNGVLWAGGSTGIWIISEDDTTILGTEHGMPSDYAFTLAFALDGQTWVGTDSGIAVLDGFEVVETIGAETFGEENTFIVSMFAASDGSIWVSTTNDVFRFTSADEWTRYGIGNPFSANLYRVQSFTEDTAGNIWIATLGDSVYRFDGDNFTHYVPTDPGVRLPSVEVNFGYADPSGGVWFGTNRGAAYFDGDTWSRYSVEDGLAHPNVNAIYVDADGAVWFATSGGISRLESK